MKVMMVALLVLIAAIGMVTVAASTTPVLAQTSCSDVIAAFSRAVTECRELNRDWACYGSPVVQALPEDLRFTRPGDRQPISIIRSIVTNPRAGASVLYIQPSGEQDPVNVIVFGGADADPTAGQSNVFTLRSRNQTEICENTPSGMIVHTDEGQSGSITVNGVVIELASTAYILMESADTMVVVNVEGEVTAVVGEQRQPLPVGTQVTVTGIAVGEPTLGGPPVASDYASSAVATWAAGPEGLTQVEDPNTVPDPAIPACGGEIRIGQTITSANTAPGQECIYTFCAEVGGQITASARSLGQGLDPYIDLRGPDLNLIKANDDISATNANSLICNQPAPATSCGYAVVVRSFRNDSSGPFELTLEGTSDCQAPPDRCEVVSPAGLNLREGPGTQFPRVQLLAPGTQVEVKARSTDQEWNQVEVLRTGQDGWVNNNPRLLYCDEPAPGQPSESITQTPTPTPVPTITPTPEPPPTPTPRGPKLGSYEAP